MEVRVGRGIESGKRDDGEKEFRTFVDYQIHLEADLMRQ